jgi:predicted transposase/invertase (TIGR01784 family)
MVKRYDGKFIRYSSLKPVYTLNILGYTHFRGDEDALRIFTLYDKKRDKSFEVEYLTIAYFELEKNNIETANQRHWREYFKTGEALVEAPEYIKKAARIIERANMTQKERDMIDQLQRAEDIYDSVIYTAQIEGERIGETRGIAIGEAKLKEERLNIVRNLLGMNMPIDQIVTATGATLDEVKSLRITAR